MDLELGDIFRQAVNDAAPARRNKILRFLSFVDSYPAVGNNAASHPADVLTTRLLWLMSHYGSAMAASHGLHLAYLHADGESAVSENRLAALAGILPTSLVLKVLHHQPQQTWSFRCGGKRSDFEADDLQIYDHSQDGENRLGMILIRQGSGDVAGDWVNRILAQQPLLSHVLILRPNEQEIRRPDSIATWDGVIVSGILPGWAVDVFSNPCWEQDMRASPLGFHQAAPDAVVPEAPPSRQVPVADVRDFPGCRVIEEIPAETLAGVDLAVYYMGENGETSLQHGRLDNRNTHRRVLLECQDVCVSGAGLVWRDDRVLLQSLVNEYIYEPLESVNVTEPTEYLAGTYFLLPTTVTAHSHWMLESLRKLHFAQPYQPDIKILASKTLSASQRDYLPLFGFPAEKCVFRDLKQGVRVEKLIFSHESPLSYDRRSLRFLQQSATAFYDPQAGRCERLYLSRRDCRLYRNLVNEEEIEQVFKGFGFQIVMASELSARDKMELFATAKYVAGPLGAAFHYATFGVQTDFIALTSDLYFPNLFMGMSSIMMNRMNYINGIGLKMYGRPWDYEHSSFYLPPDLATTALQNILK